ncbi:hypothetical protein [Streptomyces sp. TSRI0107]|uniref:hypothetical protein n=1 Tax=Streptomyces sp. TSRI0107 TaxID=1703942 RepID=UPI000A41D7AE|nr:hypothetical protein [Streptomyces sp. TSRI0107]
MSTTVQRVFGVPTVLTGGECAQVVSDLTLLWRLTYGSAPAKLEADLALCKQFFDPLARGHSLRDRLGKLPETPSDLLRRISQYGEPLAVQAGDKVLLVGLEARLILDLLEKHPVDDDHLVLVPSDVASAEHTAMEIYRTWSTARLHQVVALRRGQGREVMQAIAVGVVIALLVNRSDTEERAVVRWHHSTADGQQVDSAIFAGAEAFAAEVSRNRSSRAVGEQRLKGGYALSEARRRLADQLVVTPDDKNGGERLYIPAEHRQAVIAFLGRDLGRRPRLTPSILSSAFDLLVGAYRRAAGELAHRGMVFERSTDTRSLKDELLREFSKAQRSSGQSR